MENGPEGKASFPGCAHCYRVYTAVSKDRITRELPGGMDELVSPQAAEGKKIIKKKINISSFRHNCQVSASLGVT